MPDAYQELHSIHSMLASGHRSVYLERHSLFLIGAVGGFLGAATEWVITADRFPDNSQRGLVLLLWLAAWLGGVSLLDHWLTRRARQKRAETLPFAQAQITRAWWMLLLVIGALVGQAFITSVNLYAEASGIGGGAAALSQGLSDVKKVSEP